MRMAASTLRESDSYLGAQFRRLRSRLGPAKAITAMAAKLSRLVYRMLRFGQEYVDKGTALYEEKYRQQKLKLAQVRHGIDSFRYFRDLDGAKSCGFNNSF